MTPEKCNVCNAPVRTDHSKTYGFVVMECGSNYGTDGKCRHQSSYCISDERDQLAARVKRLEEAGNAMASVVRNHTNGALADDWERAKEVNRGH